MEVFIEEPEIISRIPAVMRGAHSYGPWALPIPKVIPTTSALYTMENVTRLFEDQTNYAKDTKVLEYLIKEGFLILRLDVDQNNQNFVETTPMGRELKMAVTLERYNEIQAAKAQKIIDEENYRIAERKRGIATTVMTWVVGGSTFVTLLIALLSFYNDDRASDLQRENKLTKQQLINTQLELELTQKELIKKANPLPCPQSTVVIKNYNKIYIPAQK